MNGAFVGVLLLGAAPFAAGCGGATSVDDPSPPPAASTGAGSGTQAQSCTPVSLVATPGQMVTSLVVVDHQLYWTALETDGTGSVSTARSRPAQVALRSMSTSGQDVRTLVAPPSPAGTAAIAFDAQSVYVAAADGIHVIAK